MMNKAISISTLLFMSQLSLAQDLMAWEYDAYKVDNPNELAYYLTYDAECPGDANDVTETIEGVFVRSRIKPLRDDIFDVNTTYLNIIVSCLRLDDNNPVFSVDISFGRYSPSPPILYDRDYGSTGIGGEDFLFETIKEDIEGAITAFIKVNFDL